jgi:exopolysaccharide production protein ExoY
VSRSWTSQIAGSLGALRAQPAKATGLLPEADAADLQLGLGQRERAGAEGQYADVRRSVQPVGGVSKRFIDISIAASGLILVAPLFVLIALLIKCTSKGPAIFAHTRIGFGGKSFRCYKFRTMINDAEARLAEYLASDPVAAQQWRDCRKLPHDPRVTPIGHLLRKSSLDELPQLFNILKGDMSCVGPRPIVSDEFVHYGPFAHEYLRARPGLTGLWQVTGRSSTDYAWRVSSDVAYVRSWSIWGDVSILFRTALAVLRFRDAC